MRTFPKVAVLIILLLCGLIQAQENLLQSGPMLGYSTMREVAIWVQTTDEAQVYFEYWDKKIHKQFSNPVKQ